MKKSKQELYREACGIAASLIETMDLDCFWSEETATKALDDHTGRQLQKLTTAQHCVVAMLRCKSMASVRASRKEKS